MKRKVVACAVLACVLAPAAFAGCAGGSVDASTQAGASPDAAPVMPVNHSSARFDAMGASGCYGCHGAGDNANPMLTGSVALPADHYQDGDVDSRSIDRRHLLCNTCHVVADGSEFDE